MKIHEIKEMKNEEIIQRIQEEEKNLVDLRFSHQLKQLTNTAKIKNVKMPKWKSVVMGYSLLIIGKKFSAHRYQQTVAFGTGGCRQDLITNNQ